jgi:hypothetical protein
MQTGERVEVNWGRRGWLPGTLTSFESCPDHDEDFIRVHVQMDNGFACSGTGYHPDCVRPVSGR